MYKINTTAIALLPSSYRDMNYFIHLQIDILVQFLYHFRSGGSDIDREGRLCRTAITSITK